MSDTDSFIDEVTEEVRRDRLFGLMRKYGWIAILAVVLIVAGASWSEYQKARSKAAAEAMGDGILAALDTDDPEEQATRLASVEGTVPGSRAIVAMLRASALVDAGDIDAAVSALDAVAVDPDLDPTYRNIAGFKSLVLQAGDTDNDLADVRIGFEALAQPGNPVRLLSQEQLALIDLREGDRTGAIDRLQTILEDAEITDDVRQRVLAVMQSLDALPGSDDAVSDG